MGLSGAILKYLRSSIAPHAFSREFPRNGSYVVLDDYLTRIRNTGAGPNRLLTGLEMFELFISPILSALSSGCKCWVVMVDVRGRVAAQKYAEQKARDSSLKKLEEKKGKDFQKYSPYCIVGNDGIFVPTHDAAKREIATEEEFQKLSRVPELIDAMKLAATRGRTRESLMDYLATKTRGFLSSRAVLLPGQSIIFDYCNGSPLQIAYGNLSIVKLDRYIHPFGEGDQMTGFWATIFRNNNLFLHTSDSDQLAQFLQWIVHLFPHLSKKYYWRRWQVEDKKTKEKAHWQYVDMKELATCLMKNELEKQLKIHLKETSSPSTQLRLKQLNEHMRAMLNVWIFTWEFLCIALGTDYTQKAMVARGLGDEKLMDCVIKMNACLKDLQLDVWTMQFTHKSVWPAPFAGFKWVDRTEEVLSQALEEFWPRLLPLLPERLRSASKLIAQYAYVPYLPPHPDLVKLTATIAQQCKGPINFIKAAESIAWNMQYWNINWSVFLRAPEPGSSQPTVMETDQAETSSDPENGDEPLNITKKRTLSCDSSELLAKKRKE